MNLALVAQHIQPTLIIDVGANVGHWATAARIVWPQADLFLIEGNPECLDMLSQLGGMTYEIALLSDEVKQVTFYTRKGAPTCTGASYLREQTEFYKDENVIASPVYTERLDDVCSHLNLGGDVLLKLDVQGAELDILRGGENVLAKTKAVIAEVSHTTYNLGAPSAAQVDTYLLAQGFTNMGSIDKIVHPISREHIQDDVFYLRK